MNTIKILICFTALINFEVVHSFNKFVVSDRELIYSWTADVKAGTYLPVPYASQFILQGKIHLQAKNHSILVKITNLTYRLHNGIIDQVQEHEANDLPVPEEVSDFENVFRIVYNEHGLVQAIATRKEEKEFSRNIKKAIATILQLKVSVIGKGYCPKSFIVQEKSIHGHGEDVYSVFPHENKIEVHKLHKMADAVDMSSHFVRNTAPAYCDVKPEKIVMHDSQKKYLLVKEKESFVIKHIESVGSIVYYPFKAQSASQIILVNQSFQLSDVVPIKEEFHVGLEYLEDSLSYHSFEENPAELTVDETNGQGVVNYEKLIPLVENMLKDIPEYLRENHFNPDEPDTKRGQLINRIQSILMRFSIQKLEELQKILPEKSLNIFYHVLPLVGSEASTLFIKFLITGKKVEDGTAVQMLQGVADIIKPSISLLQKLEDLMRLDDSFSWNVRKVAILSFGSIVHKSYLNHISNHANLNEDFQKSYEKYVDQYIENMRKSDSYIVQVTYLLGLRNMKLPILADRIIPSFNGEWFQNRNLRYMGIWAAAPPIIFNSDPAKIYQTFWPIFMNRGELTEIRAIAYYYIMYSRPSFSMLRNIITYMLTEPDEELYRFHYELSHSLMQSKEPCHQDIRLKVAQMMKFSPPPVRGSSSVNFFGYHNEKYGFSAGVQNYYIKTNESRIYGVFYTTQQFNIHDEKYFLFLKVHDGKESDPGLLAILSSFLNGQCDCYIEATLAKHDQIINTYVVDKSNVHELIRLFEVFRENSNSFVTKNLLFMNYEKYYSSLIPTDLGIPAVWEYLTPEVHYYNLSIVRENVVEDRKINIQFRNKFGSWVHFRHGLSFYNPISDAWQGINRFHSFDLLLPFEVNATVTDKIEFNWRRSEEYLINVVGGRSHAKQMVFVRRSEDHDERSLNVKTFQDVGHGKRYRRDYSWIDYNVADSGDHIVFAAFDSDIHLSYGVFQNSFSTSANPSSLYFNSPSEYVVTALGNILYDMYLQPRPGHYGLLLKLEPSVIPVTHVDVIFNEIRSTLTNKSYEHACHVTYVARNHSTILKSWDLKGVFGWNTPRDLVHWSFQVTGSIPGQKYYKLCVDGSKQWQKKDVEGHLKVRMGESDDQKCVDDTEIEVTMRGQKSKEQLEGKNKDANCQDVVPNSTPFYYSMDCLFSNSTLRHYIYKGSTKNVSRKLRKSLTTYWNALRSLHPSHYSYKSEANEEISDDSFKVDVLYPLNSHEVNIDIETFAETSEFSGIPIKHLKYFGLAPDSTVYSHEFLKQYETGEMDYCVIHGDHYYVNKHYASEEVPKSWKVYLKHELFNLSLKKINHKLALKVVYHKNRLEIIPDDHDYHIILNDVVLTSDEELQVWMYYRVFTENHHKVVTVFLRRPEVLCNFDGHHLEILIPKSTFDLEGLCLK